ncbi:hypothetical protein ACIBKZ_15650 [Streptomyces sp. NPDC050421]|uniref:hypothetical protein n=1 Tax=Streptomyces sp. NPDC050421 TaxID=3365613 RepID=UPI0037A606CC
MALQIFATDPDAMPKPKPKSTYTVPDFVFRAGMQLNNRPISLANWRVTAPEQSTADAIALLMGGKVEEWETSKDDYLQVLTDTAAVEIVINGSKAIDDRLILWGRSGPIHECDGVKFLSPAEEKGNPCGCPGLMRDRKDMAQSGRGPAPAISIRFRLAHDYDLGEGKLQSGAWSLATVLHEIRDALDDIDGEALCRLELVHVEFVGNDGKKKEFRKPVITVLGSYNDAIADER